MMERSKQSHLDTANICWAAGFVFQPLILEAHGGGWSSALRHATEWISSAASAQGIEKKSVLSLKIAQRISCSLQRENARAILRRTVPLQATAAMGVQVADAVDVALMTYQ